MKFEISGGSKLFGSVEVESSKNAILPIMAACVMIKEKVTILNVPEFSDIKNMSEILKKLGAVVEKKENNLEIDCSKIENFRLDENLTKKIRASVFLLGPLISRLGRCEMCAPGGCNIGKRPIDIHLAGFQTLGVNVAESKQTVSCNCQSFKGGEVWLKMPSVGATENLIMCATLQSERTTILHGVAKEPEVVDLCRFLNKCGAKISGEGTDTITIVGVCELHAADYLPIGDRIIAGTYMLAVALCGGELEIKNAKIDHNKWLVDFLCGFGCKIWLNGDNIYVSSVECAQKCANIKTEPYPNFPTDLQSQTMVLLCNISGTHTIVETMFENRLGHATELAKMGANITVDQNQATIFGKKGCLVGATVQAHDLRGGAALVLAGLAAKGKTIVENVEYIDRGYENFEQKLASIGAKIHRIQNEEEKYCRN
ncbi:MAG: UDP-N-acetylglucosamine 1-carboxyvinyltransferase [Clostridia bacterium]|nr:UDP-N-acetylglucosamine 1-carboxyvinyltransferase [Clostridia bacterium]